MHTQHDEVVSLTSELIRIDTSNYGRGSGSERPAAEYVASHEGHGRDDAGGRTGWVRERFGVRVLDRFRFPVS